MLFVRAGFRAIRDVPALAFAEIAWRWTFGVATWIAVVLMVRTIMAGVDVTPVEKTLGQSSDAFRIADAIARVLVQVLPRFVSALAVAVPVLALVWIAAATLGRVVTVRALATGGTGIATLSGNVGDRVRPFMAIFVLNVLRTLFTIAAVVAFFGTVFFVSANSSPEGQSATAPLLVFAWMLQALFLSLVWGVVNWFLALAPIFCVQHGSGAWRAIGDSLELYRQRPRDYLAIASGFGLIRLAAFVIAILAGFVVVAAGSIRVAVVLSILVALVYFAVADCLYIARLGAYVSLASAPPAAVPVLNVNGSAASPS